MPNQTYNVGAINQGFQSLAQGIYDNPRAEELGAQAAMRNQMYGQRARENAISADAAAYDLARRQTLDAQKGGIIKGFVDAFMPYLPARETPETSMPAVAPAPPRNAVKDPSAYNEETGQVASIIPGYNAGDMVSVQQMMPAVRTPMVSPEAFNAIVGGLVNEGKIGDVPKGIADTFAAMLGLTGKEKDAYIAHVLQGKGAVSPYQSFTPEGQIAAEGRKLNDDTNKKNLEADRRLEVVREQQAGANDRNAATNANNAAIAEGNQKVKIYGIQQGAATAERAQNIGAQTSDLNRNNKGPNLPNKAQDVYATREMIKSMVHSKLGTKGDIPEPIMNSIYNVMTKLMETTDADMGTAIAGSIAMHPNLKDTAFTSGGKVGGDATVDPSKNTLPQKAQPQQRQLPPSATVMAPALGGGQPGASTTAPSTTPAAPNNAAVEDVKARAAAARERTNKNQTLTDEQRQDRLRRIDEAEAQELAKVGGK